MLNRLGTYVWKLMRFMIAVSFIVALLALLNWLPELIQQQRLKKYSSVDSAQKELNLKKLHLPTYIPEHLNIAWPPSEVFAQEVPFEALIMHFTFRGKKEIGLIIQQAESRAPYALDPIIRIRRQREAGSVFIRDRKATLVTALCDQDTPCNQLKWDEGGISITLTGKCSAQDLIRIATSMHPEA